MGRKEKRPGGRFAGAAWWIVLVAAACPAAIGQERQDLAQLVAQVDPAVVTIAVSDKSLGSGFVVDAQGLVLTNYHVIEGAKEAVVIFPDKTRFKVEGFLSIVPKKDLALLRIQPGAKRLQALRVAEQPPAKGEKVYAFGAPMGLSGSVSDGIVAALRPGEDVRDTLRKLTNRDIYADLLDYDLDAQWLQTTAPISPGNSGGPLVNARGEVVGINTWVHALGQNLNFALSAVHLKPMLAAAGTTLHPLAELPKPRPDRQEGLKGDGKKTLALWNQLNGLKAELTKKVAAQDKKVKENSVPVGTGARGIRPKLNKMAAARREQGKAYAAYASEIKTFELEGADPEFAVFAIAEADLAQRFAVVYQDFGTVIAADVADGVAVAEHNLRVLGSALTSLRSAQDVLRMALAKRYNLKFPSFETVLKEGAKAASGAAEAAEAAATVDRSAPRLWTDRTGQFQVRAKYLGDEDGKVKLEKADGTVIHVPLDRLSEEDQKFLGADKRVE
jgi:S1-C subfamily serine protease